MATHTYKKVVAAVVLVAFCWIPAPEVKAVVDPVTAAVVGVVAVVASVVAVGYGLWKLFTWVGG